MPRGNSRRFAQKSQGGRESRYGLIGVPRNTRISLDTDRYRRNLPEFRRTGTIVRRAGSYCWIEWDDTDEPAEYLAESDVRYWVDSGKARLQQPKKPTVFDAKKID